MLFLWLFLFHYFILVFAKAFWCAFSGFWRAFNNLQWISVCPISWLLNLRITDQINRKLVFFHFIIPRMSKNKVYLATDFSQAWLSLTRWSVRPLRQKVTKIAWKRSKMATYSTYLSVPVKPWLIPFFRHLPLYELLFRTHFLCRENLCTDGRYRKPHTND